MISIVTTGEPKAVKASLVDKVEQALSIAIDDELVSTLVGARVEKQLTGLSLAPLGSTVHIVLRVTVPGSDKETVDIILDPSVKKGDALDGAIDGLQQQGIKIEDTFLALCPPKELC